MRTSYISSQGARQVRKPQADKPAGDAEDESLDAQMDAIEVRAPRSSATTLKPQSETVRRCWVCPRSGLPAGLLAEMLGISSVG